MSDQSRSAGPDPTADGPLRAARSPAGLADAVRDQASVYADRHKTEAAGILSDLAKSIRSRRGCAGQAFRPCIGRQPRCASEPRQASWLARAPPRCRGIRAGQPTGNGRDSWGRCLRSLPRPALRRRRYSDASACRSRRGLERLPVAGAAPPPPSGGLPGLVAEALPGAGDVVGGEIALFQQEMRDNLRRLIGGLRPWPLRRSSLSSPCWFRATPW